MDCSEKKRCDSLSSRVHSGFKFQTKIVWTLKIRFVSSSLGLQTITNAILSLKDIQIADTVTACLAMKNHTGKSVELESLSIEQQNQILATIVQEHALQHGYIPGWELLADATPTALHPRLMKDVSIAANVYGRLKSGTHSLPPTDLRMSVGPNSTYESVYRVGPKSLGGTAWKANKECQEFMKNPIWNAMGYSQGFPPSVAIGWIGIQRKTTPVRDTAEVVALQLLGTVDFDLDLSGDNNTGFEEGFRIASQYAGAAGTSLQRAAFIGMINYDFQIDIRPIRNRWVVERKGPWNLGPMDVAPEDWTAYLVADCAALVPFGYDADYLTSRIGMANGMIFLQCQVLIFDTGCSNRAVTVPYAESAGVAKFGIHAAYAVTAYTATAKHVLDFNDLCFGYSATLIAGVWGPFQTRYRVWERFIKYTRQLKKSDPGNLLDISFRDLLLKDYDLTKEVGEEWARAMRSDDSDLMARPTAKYFVPVADLFNIPGVQVPKLCHSCASNFDEVMRSQELEEIHALEGLPDVFGRRVSLAVGIRRAATWACDTSCDSCACKVGYWADQAAYIVLVATMQDEAILGQREWMLQNYLVGCVALWPVSMSFLLSGFDLTAELSFEEGAMGDRDVVDI
ncbi:hypothetical protein DL98DRAFT_576031 [Cadophora sp. DSE1049]|nr:hypothetical protein DL98DRAFT_576031 [Cadophora sp. DSE1049]